MSSTRVAQFSTGVDRRGLGKLLVVAPDQVTARRYADILRAWVPAAQAATVQLATCEERDAHEMLARFRLTAEPSVLVTVAMSHEGLDAPEVAVVGEMLVVDTIARIRRAHFVDGKSIKQITREFDLERFASVANRQGFPDTGLM